MSFATTVFSLATAAALLSQTAQASTIGPTKTGATIKAASSDGIMTTTDKLPFAFSVHNTADVDMRWVCWKEVPYSGTVTSDVKDNAPEVNDVIAAGKTGTFSAELHSAIDCMPVYPNTQQLLYGPLINTKFSFNGGAGIFYVDGGDLPAGDTISAKSDEGCTSDHDNCSYECSDASLCPGSSKMSTCKGTNAMAPVGGTNGGCLWRSGKIALTVSNSAKNVTSS